MQSKNPNFLRLWIRDSMYSLGSVLSSASVMQILYLRLGMDEKTISLNASFTQAMYLLFSIIAAAYANRIGKFHLTENILYFAQAALIASNIFLCLFPGLPLPVLILIVYVITTLANIANTVRVVLDYRLLCAAVNLEHYSTYTSVSGICIGVVGILPGLVIPYFYANYDYYRVTAVICLLAGLVTAIAACLNISVKFLHEPQTLTEEKKKPHYSTRDLFHDKDFLEMIVPNFLRGLGTGVISVLPLLAVRYAGMDEKTSVLMTTVQYAATFIGCALYGLTRSKRAAPTLLSLIGSAMFFLLCFSFTGSPMWFLIMYFFAYLGYNTVNYAIPDLCFLIVPEEAMSLYQTWRMAFTTLGNILSVAAIGFLIEIVDGRLILFVSTVLLFLCCAAYYKKFRNVKTVIKK